MSSDFTPSAGNEVLANTVRAFLQPISQYLDDPKVSEIMINGPKEIFYEKGGKLHASETTFADDYALMAAVRNIAQFVGRMINEERPTMDARLPDGSRIHIVIPPCARKGAYIAIRKFFKEKLGIKNLIEFKSLSVNCAKFLQLAILMKKNVIISGGTSSGKTTILNVVSTLIPDDERIIVIEDSSELQLQKSHLVPMETRPPDKEGKNEVPIRELLKSSLRMRPDRIVIGEIRGGEALDLLQAMNTGHSGSMTTLHANNPRQAMSRLETLSLMSGVELPHLAIKNQIASAIDIVIQASRLRDGSRKITHISEVLDLDERGEYIVKDVFRYHVTGISADGTLLGAHRPTGYLPSFFHEAVVQGFKVIGKEAFDAPKDLKEGMSLDALSGH